ncbi:Sodium/hydrogen exchanger [Sistotremastrum suecicum HHB10207 ss-3]|uniref:Sodium/hydrogen exchanger n=1 Tax=Sistotremastrum suecicum HHB10207 ss-3 TaxID=1314776 RepID=A0A165XIJ4_9AGAM|nr:Sodium/hydrogen exchanger [Sistotremastrum suecicum HHB10207 ss-3]
MMDIITGLGHYIVALSYGLYEFAMTIQLVEVTTANLTYLCLGGFIVAFTTVALLVREKLYLGECVLATAFGIAIGPSGGNIFNPRSWGDINDITLEVMRIVLATGVFSIGVELPKAYMLVNWKSLVFMIVPTMTFGWFISAGLIVALFPALNFRSALVISACLTPTDPILAMAIIMGKFAVKHVPKHLRLLLAAESAANDGLAYPFLTLPLYLTLEATTGSAVGKWLLVGCLYQVILGTVIGAVAGSAFRYLLRFNQNRGFIDHESFVAQYLALAVFVVGFCNIIGSDDLLAAFAAGTAISWDGDFNAQTENAVFASILDLILNCAAFIYIGAWIPFDKFTAADLGIAPWRLIVLAIALIVARRIPALLLLQRFVPDLRNWREALFSGHFGPMGVGAVYISTLALTKLPKASDPPASQAEQLSATIQPIVAFIVLCSIIVHGLSIPFFNLGRHVRTMSHTSPWTETSTSKFRAR